MKQRNKLIKFRTQILKYLVGQRNSQTLPGRFVLLVLVTFSDVSEVDVKLFGRVHSRYPCVGGNSGGQTMLIESDEIVEPFSAVVSVVSTLFLLSPAGKMRLSEITLIND